MTRPPNLQIQRPDDLSARSIADTAASLRFRVFIVNILRIHHQCLRHAFASSDSLQGCNPYINKDVKIYTTQPKTGADRGTTSISEWILRQPQFSHGSWDNLIFSNGAWGRPQFSNRLWDDLNLQMEIQTSPFLNIEMWTTKP